ncbi:UbiA-like polyprenyltransferase [Rikenella microfusus]|uniref:4-hydroxybenzoate octaprenyltransferase n=1 Tax=Rikenella microfusus TaxID=28139 RepID=A0A379MRU8_9BACT|nr:UbiA-like polyprenyltransferase [Rikenella microfusus]SUE34381.1 4-hydroxybenzoate octaprenyltransferase [Rikenella microfusus]
MAGIKDYFALVKFAHTAFALPFALIGYTLGVKAAGFDPWTLVAVLACMVFARNAAMGFNRVVDRRFDAKNPRTATREIPSGKIGVRAGRWFVVLNSVAFIAVTAVFNPLTLALSPVVLLVVLGYSYTKRFTALCHLVLGLGLAIAPSAAYIAVTGTLAPAPVGLSVLVLTWVSGFDIIYALQDTGFDRSERLHSIPAALGVRGALRVSELLHVVTVVMVAVVGAQFGNGPLYWIGATVFLGLLLYQHLIVRPDDLSRIGAMFGLTNGLASIAYAFFVILGLVLV